MTISTFAAGLLIVTVTTVLELLDKDFEKQQKKFENSK